MPYTRAVTFAATFLFLSVAPTFAQTGGESTVSKRNGPSDTRADQRSTDPSTETGARPSSTPSNGAMAQPPTGAQTTGSAAPDSGEGPSPLSSDDPTGLKKA